VEPLPGADRLAVAIDNDRRASEALRVLGAAYHESLKVEALEKLRGIATFVGTKKAPRWRWHASEHGTGAVLASGFGRRTDEVFVWWQTLLEPCGITRSLTDHGGAEARHRAPEEHHPGTRNTQTIARKPLTLRTRMQRRVRQTRCLSPLTQMHDILIGLCVNRPACGRAVSTWPLHFANTTTIRIASPHTTQACAPRRHRAAPRWHPGGPRRDSPCGHTVPFTPVYRVCAWVY
jgi:insertion element IS1 protein InsB